MTAFDYLRTEHRRIEQMLVALEAAAIEIEASGKAPAFAGDLLDFFRMYADVRHHAKEEAFLFPAMARHGVGPDGMVGAMSHQHDMGRVHVRDMRRALDRVLGGDVAARAAFATSAHAYVELLRVHIQIEDDELYPVAERLFSSEEQQALLREFHSVDDTNEERAQYARWETLVARIHEPVRHR